MHQTLAVGRLPLAITCLALLVPASALCQESPPSLPRGLFGSNGAEGDGRNKLNVILGLSERFDTEVPPELRSQGQEDLLAGGASTILSASADYAYNRYRAQLVGNVSTAFRYYERLDRTIALSHNVGLGATVRLPKQASLQINQTATYSPSYLYQLFPVGDLAAPAETPLAAVDYRIYDVGSYSYDTTMALTLLPQRRTRLTASADYRRTDFPHETAFRSDLTTYGARGNVSRSLSRTVGLVVEYEYRTGQFWFDELTQEHRVSFGMIYSRALSQTRRATFRFNLAPSTINAPASAVNSLVTRFATRTDDPPSTGVEEPAPIVGAQRLYRLQGGASAEYPFRLNWGVRGNYRRGFDYVAVLNAPILSQGARIDLAGLITRRVDVSAAAGYATGTSVFFPTARNLETYTGEATIRYALNRSLALYSKYLYYYYDLRGQGPLAPDMPRVVHQHGVRVGLVFFVQTLGR